MEQRIVKLDIETAKEWYNQGGELRKVALQAFTEQELNPKVQVWENIPELKGRFIRTTSQISEQDSFPVTDTNKNVALTEKHCKKMLAIAQISQLMPYYGGAITDKEWDDEIHNKYVIQRYKQDISIKPFWAFYHFLAFHTKEQSKDFLKYNERLVKDYYMMD